MLSPVRAAFSSGYHITGNSLSKIVVFFFFFTPFSLADTHKDGQASRQPGMLGVEVLQWVVKQ